MKVFVVIGLGGQVLGAKLTRSAAERLASFHRVSDIQVVRADKD